MKILWNCQTTPKTKLVWKTICFVINELGGVWSRLNVFLPFFYFGYDIMCPFVCVWQLWQWQNNTIDFSKKRKLNRAGDARRGSVCAKRAVIGVKREWESLSLQNGDLSCYCWKQHIIFRIKHVIEAIPISRWAWRTSLPEVNQLSARES